METPGFAHLAWSKQVSPRPGGDSISKNQCGQCRRRSQTRHRSTSLHLCISHISLGLHILKCLPFDYVMAVSATEVSTADVVSWLPAPPLHPSGDGWSRGMLLHCRMFAYSLLTIFGYPCQWSTWNCKRTNDNRLPRLSTCPVSTLACKQASGPESYRDALFPPR